MLKKEIKDTLGEFTIISVLIISISIIALIKGFDFYLIPLLELILILYPVFSGWSIFDREKKENAFEHLLSLPVGKATVLINKLIPRLVSILTVLIAYIPLRNYFAHSFFLEKNKFIILYLLLFVLSFAFSLLFNNIAMVISSIILIIVVLILIDIKIWKLLSYTEVYTFFAVSVLTFPLIFIYSFFKDDILPLKSFNGKFIKRLAVSFVVILIGLTIIINVFGLNNYNYFNLTKDGKIIERGRDQLKAFDAETGNLIIKVDYKFHNTVYKDNVLYGWGKENNKFKIISIDLTKKNIRTLYEIDGKYWLSKAHVDRDRITFLLSRGDKCKYFLILKDEKISKIAVPENSIKGMFISFKLISKSPLRFFWTTNSYKSYEYSEGKAKELFTGEIKYYKNRILFNDDKTLKVYEIGNPEPIFINNEGGTIFTKWFAKRDSTT